MKEIILTFKELQSIWKGKKKNFQYTNFFPLKEENVNNGQIRLWKIVMTVWDKKGLITMMAEMKRGSQESVGLLFANIDLTFSFSSSGLTFCTYGPVFQHSSFKAYMPWFFAQLQLENMIMYMECVFKQPHFWHSQKQWVAKLHFSMNFYVVFWSGPCSWFSWGLWQVTESWRASVYFSVKWDGTRPGKSLPCAYHSRIL